MLSAARREKSQGCRTENPPKTGKRALQRRSALQKVEAFQMVDLLCALPMEVRQGAGKLQKSHPSREGHDRLQTLAWTSTWHVKDPDKSGACPLLGLVLPCRVSNRYRPTRKKIFVGALKLQTQNLLRVPGGGRQIITRYPMPV